MFLEGRPPVNVGVTSNGDVFGGTQITFGDVLGDKQFNVFAVVDLAVPHAVAQLRQPGAALPVRAAGLLADAVLLRAARGRLLRSRRSRRSSAAIGAMATRTVRGGTRLRHLPVQPLPPRRAVGAGSCNLNEQYNDPALAGLRASSTSSSSSASRCSATARWCRSASAFVQETTVFREFGPLAGSTMRLALRRRAEDRQHAVAPDLRRRRPLLPAPRHAPACSRCASAASRASATIPTSSTSAATPKCAATTTCSSSARTSCFANAELRFPIIEAALTPIGVVGGVRGVFFANIGGGWFDNQGFKFATNND